MLAYITFTSHKHHPLMKRQDAQTRFVSLQLPDQSNFLNLQQRVWTHDAGGLRKMNATSQWTVPCLSEGEEMAGINPN